MPHLNGVFTAIMPQPISTPTVAGITASFVATTEPTMLPLPRCASGISATCLNRHGRRETLRTMFSIEEQNMVRNVSRLPCLFKHVALMPDAHLGKGSMVGSVVATKEAVIPATVGVDIGCGMMAVK